MNYLELIADAKRKQAESLEYKSRNAKRNENVITTNDSRVNDLWVPRFDHRAVQS